MTIGKSRFSLRERERGLEVYPDDYREVPFLAQKFEGCNVAAFFYAKKRKATTGPSKIKTVSVSYI